MDVVWRFIGHAMAVEKFSCPTIVSFMLDMLALTVILSLDWGKD